MPDVFCLDTGVFIQSWNFRYPIRAFPDYWDDIEMACENGLIISPEMVKIELKRKTDRLYSWASDPSRSKLFIPFDDDIQIAQADIINKYPKLINASPKRDMADPWVIALAKISGGIVVSEEGPGSHKKPKIPDVCAQEGIECIKIVDMILEFGWIYRRR